MKILPKSYGSVKELVRATLSPEFADYFEAYVAERELVTSLERLRISKGITQAEIAALMGCGQAKVSKLERSMDADLKLGDVIAYAKALGMGIRLAVEAGTTGFVVEAKGRPKETGRKRVRKKA
jgi:transcriptional regulator with XRE-family HTH domain